MNYYTDAFKKYAVFEGKATRKEFWMFVLINFLISVAISMVSNELFSGLYALATFVPSIAIGARRLHDTGRSGWMQLISLIPFIGIIILIVFFAQESKAGEGSSSAPVQTSTPVSTPASAPTQAEAPSEPQQ